MDLGRARVDFLKGYFSTNDRRKKTRSAYFSDLDQFQRFLGSEFDLLALQCTDIERWAAHLKQAHYSPASIRRKLVVLKVFCHYWLMQGLLEQSPFWKLRINVGRTAQLPRTLTEREVQGLLDQAQASYAALEIETDFVTFERPSERKFLALRNAALVELLFATGLRVSEISAIDLEDFIVCEAAIKVHGKGGRERMAFVVDDNTLSVQSKYLSLRRRVVTQSRAFFVNASGGRLSAQGIANVVHRLRKTCGIDRTITPHMLRHTVATQLLRNGTDIRVVQEFLGHASIVTTQRYTHIAKEHMISELSARHPSLAYRSSRCG